MLQLAYGRKINSLDDHFARTAEETEDMIRLAVQPGRWLVDTFPARASGPRVEWRSPAIAVRHMPDWMPGAGFKATGRAWRATLDKMADFPHNFVKSQMVCLSITSGLRLD